MNKKRITFLAILLLTVFGISMVYATVFSSTYDTATPAGSDDPAEADDRMREIKASVQERENVDHYWPLTGTEVSDADVGEHRKVLFHAPIAATPTVAENHGDLRTKDVANGTDTKAELVFTNEAEAELQLSSNGKNLANNVALTADNAAGDGAVDLIKATTGDIPEILTGAVLSDSTPPSVDAGVANKLYVDNRRAYIKLVDAKPTTTNGGTFTAGAWQKRTVTEETDTGSNVSVSSSVIVLAAGTYECRIYCPAFDVDQNQARLRNTTAGTTIKVGTNGNANSGSNSSEGSIIVGRFTIAGSQNVEIQHQCQTSKSTNGFGAANSFGEVEVYTIAEFWKI